jgi:hypothetical protein
MRAAANALAGFFGKVRARGQKLGRKCPGRRALTGAPRSVKQVGMGRPAIGERRCEDGASVGVAVELSEHGLRS